MLRRLSILLLSLAILVPQPAAGKPKAAVRSAEVPSLEATLNAAGWTMTPERSASYTVGDIYSRSTNTPVAFKADCFDAEPRENAYTSLEVIQAMKAGARVPLGVARFKAEGMEYKQLKFAEPYITELADMHLRPNDNCQQFLAARNDLADLFVIKAVLSAEVKEQLCKSLDASAGGLGFGANADAQQECNQASEGHVAVAYKTQPVESLVAGTAPTPAPELQSATAAAPIRARTTANVDFGASGSLGVAARLQDQECLKTATTMAERARATQLSNAEAEVQATARAAWAAQSAELQQCVGLPRADRGDCIAATERWLDTAKAMPIQISAGVETIEQECGTKDIAFPAKTKTVVAADVDAAKALLQQLKGGKSGEFIGVGLELEKDRLNNHVYITKVIEGSPAFHAGLKPNQRIEWIDERVPTGSLEGTMSMLRGKRWKAGDVVAIFVAGIGVRHLVREKIEIRSGSSPKAVFTVDKDELKSRLEAPDCLGNLLKSTNPEDLTKFLGEPTWTNYYTPIFKKNWSARNFAFPGETRTGQTFSIHFNYLGQPRSFHLGKKLPKMCGIDTAQYTRRNVPQTLVVPLVDGWTAYVSAYDDGPGRWRVH